MTEGGPTPMQGIVAATSGAAAALGVEDVGVIRAGAVADLLVLDGDPLRDPSLLQDPERIHLVLQAGTPAGATR